MRSPPPVTSAERGATGTSRALSYDHGVRAMFFAYLLFVVAGIVFYSLVGALHY
jgi:hypothetical protein